MDLARRSQAGRVTALLLCLYFSSQALPQEPPADDPIATVKRLYAERRWEDIVQSAPPSADLPAELDLYRGLALAQLQRWDEARVALETGRKKDPRDKRFPLELAGIAYRQNEFSAAKAGLKNALRLDPSDAYARDFLASAYLLEGNLEAALHHWNRIGKPHITELRLDPQPRVRAVLLDRAFAFAPAGMLRLDDLLTTGARIENMGIFPRHRFELLPDRADSFALTSRLPERNGWGGGKLDALLSLLRGLPYQSVQPEYYNLNRSSMNLRSMFRWDSQKRRLFASFSAPLVQEPKWRFGVDLDGRNENWDLTRTFRGGVAQQPNLNLQRIAVGADFRSIVSGRWSWSSGAFFSYRNFRGTAGIAPQAAPFFADGVSLKYRAELERSLLYDPERRLTVDSTLYGQFGKGFAERLGAFGGLGGSLGVRWLPLPRGDDYEVRSQVRAGMIAGPVPLDELFVLGIERDNDLWLRGHVGTTDGKKGSAPMGRRFVLWNWEADKIVHQNVFLTVTLGPFLDAGKITDPSGEFARGVWLWDPGLQCKVHVLGSLTFVVSYGKDLRSGRNAFYTTALR